MNAELITFFVRGGRREGVKTAMEWLSGYSKTLIPKIPVCP